MLQLIMAHQPRVCHCAAGAVIVEIHLYVADVVFPHCLTPGFGGVTERRDLSCTGVEVCAL
jgi:hypothetical protein